MSVHTRIKTGLLLATMATASWGCDNVTAPELADDAALDPPQTSHVASILALDFTPINAPTYNISWRVNQLLNWADVRIYRPLVTLNSAQTGTLFFYVMEDRPWYQNDIILGIVEVNFNSSTTPTSFRYLTRDPTGNTTRNPAGAPFQITNGFWLGCTKVGRVRGNYDKGDNAHAAVYLKRFNLNVGISLGGGFAVSIPRNVFCLPA